MSATQLRIGTGEADITPPTGLLMCGSLKPRTNVGKEDPLLAKTLVAESGGTRVAIVGVDLIGLPRAIVDPAIALAHRQTGIDADKIIVSCSHTHTGPYTADGLYAYDVTNQAYLDTLPGAIAASIAQANASLQPATMYVGRQAVYHLLHNRRVLAKDGKAINTWMGDLTNDLQRTPQLVGSEGPIDPELWVLRFENAQGQTIAAFVNFTLHVNMYFGTLWSADYPGVIAAEMRRIFGPQVTTVFTPGACANINATLAGPIHWREGAEYIAKQAIVAANRAYKVEGTVAVDGARRDVAAPRRDVAAAPKEAVGRLDWGGGNTHPDVFEPVAKLIAEMPPELSIPVNAVRIGPFALATNSGELFVEHGLDIKQRSPFPHTAVAELTNDYGKYQPTRDAMEHQGYESLVGANLVSVEGIELLVNTACELLDGLWERGGKA